MLLNHIKQAPSKRTEARNIALYLMMAASTTLTAMFASGALWHGLLLYCGLSTAAVGILDAVASVIQAAAMVLDLWLADRFKRPLLVMAVAALPGVLFYGAIPLMLFGGKGVLSFPLVLLFVLIRFSAYGFRSIFEYKVPYLIFDIKKYGPLTAISGIISNLLSVGAGLGISALLERSDYLRSMTVLYVVCTVLAVVVSISTLLMKPIHAPQETKAVPIKEVLADDSIKRLAVANFLRGISAGVIASLTLIASGAFSKDSAALSVMVTLTTLGAVLGNVLFSVVGRRFAWLSRMCLGASVALLIVGPLSILFGNWVLFLALFVALQIAYTIVNNSIPVMLAHSTPYHVIGGCTAVRMTVTMLGTALASWLCGLTLELFDGSRLVGVCLMLVSGVAQVYCGIAYHRYQKKMQAKRRES